MNGDRFSLDMSFEEREKKLVEMSDEDIDFSDIPELDETFFNRAKLGKKKPATEAIFIRVDTDTLEWCRKTAKNNLEIKAYQTLINDVPRTYMIHHQIKNEEYS